MLELGWGELGAVRGGRRGAAVLDSPGSAHPPCTSPKKAEQDIELWKKQEAAAKEAESGSPGSEQQPEVKVPPYLCRGGVPAPALSGLSGGEGLNGSWGGRAGWEVKVRVPHLLWGVITPLNRPVLSPAACPEGQEAADGHDC